MNTLISFIKATVKIVAKLALALVALSLVAVISYYSYQNYQEKQTLAFSAHPDWACSILVGDYQSCTIDELSFIRKINQENDSQIMLSIYRNSEGEKRYEVSLVWNEECVPESVIVTDLEFSDGEIKTMTCRDTAWGTVLSHLYNNNVPPTVVDFSYGGFTIDENLRTNISWLERQFTLSEVRTSDEIEADRIAAVEEERLAVEARAEEERLAEIARVEEERLAEIARVEQERVAAEARAEEERLASLARAEEERLAAERENDRLECEAVEDEREADFYRRYDNLANDIQVTTSCRFEGQFDFSTCRPGFTVKNNSRFTIERLTVGFAPIASGACADIITRYTLNVYENIRPGQTLNDVSLYSLRRGDGTRICTSINNVTVDGGRNYPRNSCN